MKKRRNGRRGPVGLAPPNQSPPGAFWMKAVGRRLGIPLLLVGCTLTAFWPVCGLDFTNFDDPATVSRNPTLNPPRWHSLLAWWGGPEMDLYIPVTYTVWGLLALGAQGPPDPDTGIRLNPSAFHTANLLLHVLSVLAVFQILRRVTGRPWPACAGALLFALHPVQVESVAWASGMKDVLCGLLSLAAVWQYVVAAGAGPPGQVSERRRRRVRYGIATSLFVLALLSKPTAAVAPLIAGALDWLALRHSARQVLRRLWPWLLLSIACAVWTVRFQPAPSVILGVAGWQRPLVAADALAFYLYKLLWPIWLGVDYGRRPVVVLQERWVYLTWLLPAVAAAGIWFWRRRAPVFAAAGLVFVAGVAPVLGLVRFDYQDCSTVADHYLYLSMLGAALAGAGLLARAPARGRGATFTAVIAATLLVGLGVRSFLQTAYWQNTMTLFAHAIEVNPRSAAAYDALSVEFARRDPARAIAFAREAITLRPDWASPHITMGAALAREGRKREARDAFRTACDLAPNNVIALNDLAGILAEAGQLGDAIELARRAADLQPGLADAHVNLGTMLARRGDLSRALDELRTAVRLAPDSFDAHNNLAHVAAAAGRPGEAIAHYQAALRIDPDSASARRGLARAYEGERGPPAAPPTPG